MFKSKAECLNVVKTQEEIVQSMPYLFQTQLDMLLSASLNPQMEPRDQNMTAILPVFWGFGVAKRSHLLSQAWHYSREAPTSEEKPFPLDRSL